MGEPEVIEGKVKFYKLPIEVEITFDDKDDLITFVDNIEMVNQLYNKPINVLLDGKNIYFGVA